MHPWLLHMYRATDGWNKIPIRDGSIDVAVVVDRT